MTGIPKTSYQEMVDSYDRLTYMIKTTAPHLQSYVVELRSKIVEALLVEALLKDAASRPVKTEAPAAAGKVIIPPPK